MRNPNEGGMWPAIKGGQGHGEKELIANAAVVGLAMVLAFVVVVAVVLFG